MSEFRRWLQEKIARLDGVRERRNIVLGATVLFLILAVGPTTLSAMETLAKTPWPLHRAAQDTGVLEGVGLRVAPTAAGSPDCTADTWSCQDWDACAESGSQARSCTMTIDCPGIATQAPDTTRSCTPPTLPALSILQPQPDVSKTVPVDLSALIKNGTAVGMIFEMRDGSGSVSSLQASPAAESGVWNAQFNGKPGDYTLSVRASFVDGSVTDFPEQRGIHVTQSTEAATSTAMTSDGNLPEDTASSATPTVELLPPLQQKTLFDASVQLYARVKVGSPDRLVFVVSAVDGGETIVVGEKSDIGDYWTGYFEGPDGDYGVSARAQISGSEIFSEPRSFALIR